MLVHLDVGETVDMWCEYCSAGINFVNFCISSRRRRSTFFFTSFAFQARAVVDYLPSPYDRDALRFSKEIWRKIIFVYFLHVTLT